MYCTVLLRKFCTYIFTFDGFVDDQHCGSVTGAKEHQTKFMKRLIYMFLTVYIKLIGINRVESLWSTFNHDQCKNTKGEQSILNRFSFYRTKLSKY